MTIQYLGFQLKPRGRDYNYRVIGAKIETREFTLTISNQAFANRQVPYQDAADLCYQKLRKDLAAETAESPVPRHATISIQELDAYRDRHRPRPEALNLNFSGIELEEVADVPAPPAFLPQGAGQGRQMGNSALSPWERVSRSDRDG